MNIYLVSQNVNTGYDTYDSFVCVAENEDDARTIHPSRFATHIKDSKWMGTYSGGAKIGEEYSLSNGDWVSVETAKTIPVTLIGVADISQKRGVILSSFNAG